MYLKVTFKGSTGKETESVLYIRVVLVMSSNLAWIAVGSMPGTSDYFDRLFICVLIGRMSLAVLNIMRMKI